MTRRQAIVERNDLPKPVYIMPMIPAALFGMLAVNRLGAIHSVVFGGFALHALAHRIDSCNAHHPSHGLLWTYWEHLGRSPVACETRVEEAISLLPHQPECVMIWQREQLLWGIKSGCNGPVAWLRRIAFGSGGGKTGHAYVSRQECMDRANAGSKRVEYVLVKSADAVCMMHISGTPKASKCVRRDASGHAVDLNFTIRYYSAPTTGRLQLHRLGLLAHRRRVQGQRHIRHPDRPSCHHAAESKQRLLLHGRHARQLAFAQGPVLTSKRSEPALISTH